MSKEPVYYPVGNRILFNGRPRPFMERIPAGTYSIGASPEDGFFLTKVPNFELPPKLYGNTNRQAERIFNTFNDRPAGTGVMLSGQKGSGKTMLAKRIAEMGLEQDVITLLVTHAYRGDGFNNFIQSIDQPAIILFDEFEKVYDRDEQQALLTLFDGTMPSKKLFIVTVNDPYGVDRYMHNRPGRMYYVLDFHSLDKEFISEYCDDNLDNKAHKDGVMLVANCFGEFSFDILKALVEEMNRYGESASDAMKMLNAKPEADRTRFNIEPLYKGQPIGYDRLNQATIDRHPLSLEDGWHIAVYGIDYTGEKTKAREARMRGEKVPKPRKKSALEAAIGEDTGRENLGLNIDHEKVIEVNSQDGSVILGTDEPDWTVRFTRAETRTTSYWNWDAV